MSRVDYQPSLYHNEKFRASPRSISYLLSSTVFIQTQLELGSENDVYQNENPAERGQHEVRLIAHDENYEYCPHCNRRFFIGRLEPHLKSCKPGKPLKPLKVISNNYESAPELSEKIKSPGLMIHGSIKTANEEQTSLKSPLRYSLQPDITHEEHQDEDKEEEESDQAEKQVDNEDHEDYEGKVEDEGNSDIESQKEQFVPGQVSFYWKKLILKLFFFCRVIRVERLNVSPVSGSFLLKE